MFRSLVGGYKILSDLSRERQYKSSFAIAGGLSRADHLVKAIILGADGIAMASSFCAVARYKGAEGVVNYIRSLDTGADNYSQLLENIPWLKLKALQNLISHPLHLKRRKSVACLYTP